MRESWRSRNAAPISGDCIGVIRYVLCVVSRQLKHRPTVLMNRTRFADFDSWPLTVPWLLGSATSTVSLWESVHCVVVVVVVVDSCRGC